MAFQNLMKFFTALLICFFSLPGITEEWNTCGGFRKEYDALAKLKESTEKERDRIQRGFRRLVNEEIQQKADGEPTGEDGEENNAASRVYTRLKKVKEKLSRLEEGMKKLSDEKCPVCGTLNGTEKVKGQPDCERCPSLKACQKEKT